MKKILLAAAFALVCTGANATCKSDANDKNGKPLAGAALSSYMKKCERDAKAKCAAESKAQKLNGAAATSHTKKCTMDAVGT